LRKKPGFFLATKSSVLGADCLIDLIEGLAECPSVEVFCVTKTESNLRKSALASGLVTADQLAEAIDAIRKRADAGPSPEKEITDRQLASQLMRMGLLTTYQADQLRAGRTRFNLGQYVITDFIGQGGMGQVFRGVHKMMGREVAVKVLPLARSTPEAIEHFRREISLQAQLDHPNLVRAYDAGHDGNVHYLVTEYVAGTDLRRLVRQEGKLSMQKAANVVGQAARGLGYAHERGMLHRDVKPGNILVSPDGTAKVSDLGLAGFMQETEEENPRAGKIVGTADYLSPDQIKNPRTITPASDLYSLGCTLYYAVTGKVPFPGGAARDKARRHFEETPWHPQRFNADLSEDFVEVIADLMEKDAELRMQTAEEVVQRLEPWAGEITPVRTAIAGRSPWAAPPPPAVPDEEVVDIDTSVSDQELSDSRQQGTHPIASSGQETGTVRRRPPRPAPPIPQPALRDPLNLSTLLIALGIAIPVSMLVGALLMFALLWMVW
jgi:serine/threonine protein kinase